MIFSYFFLFFGLANFSLRFPLVFLHFPHFSVVFHRISLVFLVFPLFCLHLSYRLNPYAGKWNIPKSFVTKDPFVFPGVSYSQTSFVTTDPFVFPRFCHYSISIHLEDVDPFDGISFPHFSIVWLRFVTFSLV